MFGGTRRTWDIRPVQPAIPHLVPIASRVSTVFDLASGWTRRPRAPLEGILDAIGDTPLVALRRFLGRPEIAVWAKLEAANPGGSAKDRPAAGMLLDALRDGRDRGRGRPSSSRARATWASGLAQACRYHGMHLICVVDARAHDTNIRTMRALGADVRVVTEPDPETGDLLVARLRLVADLLARTPGSFWPNQYANASNPAAHAAGTMREIDEALDGDVDYVFVATSTTGTLRGCVDYLRERDRATKVVAVDAAGSALFGGRHGRRLLPGFGAGVESTLSLGAEFDELVRVSDLDCVVGCRRLVEREAILAGASAGGVVHALESLAADMPADSRCVAILHDGGSGYLGTVYDDGWVERELGCDAAAAARAGRGRCGGHARRDSLTPSASMRIAIVGFGPKGLYALERLLDHAAALPPHARLEVDLFEPDPNPGAGPNYAPDQPAYLRMNFAADLIDMWWPDSRAVPRSAQHPFVRWRGGGPGSGAAYPSRADVGEYLSAGFESLLRYAPRALTIRLRETAVDAVRANGGAWDVYAADALAGSYDEVLLATGHQQRAAGEPGVFPVGRLAGTGPHGAGSARRDPGLRPHLHRCRARADGGTRGVVQRVRSSLPADVRAGGRRRRA